MEKKCLGKNCGRRCTCKDIRKKQVHGQQTESNVIKKKTFFQNSARTNKTEATRLVFVKRTH